jgi:1,4-alpha-glucan branching enzyme
LVNADAQPTDSLVFVQFRVEAIGAESVAIAGDFTGWAPEHDLEDLNGDGIWTGRVPVRPGVHSYMFVIDGSNWITDPHAERYLEDGFGNRNAVLAVTAPSA